MTTVYHFNTLRHAALVLIALLPLSAKANDTTGKAGWYAGFTAGISSPKDSNATDIFDSTAMFDTGLAANGTVGYGLSTLPIRVEFEGGYSRSDLDKIRFGNDQGLGVALGLGNQSGIEIDSEGKISTLSGIINAIYDIKTGTSFTPYIGAGAGLARISVKASTLGQTLVDDSATVFTYQAKAGVSCALSNSTSLDLGYTYRTAQDPKLTANDIPVLGAIGGRIKGEYAAQLVTVGLRMTF